MLNIQESTRPGQSVAVFNLGFRPFFLGGAAYAMIAMLTWMGIYIFGARLPLSTLPAVNWHAHEMIYGYGMAVIAGFLLTAVRNWTGIQTLHGWRLGLLLAVWMLARVMPFLDIKGGLYAMAALDLGFMLCLLGAVVSPIVRVKQWRQLGIASKLLLLTIGNACFYVSLLGWSEHGARYGLYVGFYLIIALILTMSRRLIPFFTERGVDYNATLKNRRWLDIAVLLLFVLFLVLEVFTDFRQVAAVTAIALFVLHTVRLLGWFTPGIFRHPLLWGLHAGYAFIVAGFALYAAAVYFGISPFLSVHAFAVGGIGIVTVSMMARVSLGHTGRNIRKPPGAVAWVLLALIAATVTRVFLPLTGMEHYRWWIAGSQVFWILAFAGFLAVYFPILTRPRIDGQPG
jgi:uncharacterized protein involved in response to NO